MRGGERERETDRQTDRQTDKGPEGEKRRERYLASLVDLFAREEDSRNM